jgi:hypothetical protein
MDLRPWNEAKGTQFSPRGRFSRNRAPAQCPPPDWPPPAAPPAAGSGARRPGRAPCRRDVASAPGDLAGHSAVAEKTWGSRRDIKAVLDDYRTAPIGERLCATLSFLEKLTLSPDEVGPADVAPQA